MSFSPDRNRNHSPPPEILESDGNLVPDRIGDTMYSKRWLYKTLMNMLKIVQDSSIKNNPSDEGSSELKDISSFNQGIIELDPQIEEEACTLWDMAASQEVAEFLCECDVASVFLEIIDQTKSPRLLEIVVGILGNMSSYNSTCEYITHNKNLVYGLIMLAGCSDSCTLVQLFRLFTCGVVKESCRQEWFKSFDENTSFMENLKCILENNLCRDVLKGLLEFLDTLLNYDSKYYSIWGKESYTLAVIECGKQLLKCGHYEDLDTFFTLVNTLCEQSCNVPIYGKNFDALRPVFHAYFLKLGEEEYLPQIARITALTSTFALYGNLLFSGNILSDNVKFDINVFKAMLNICKIVRQLLSNRSNSVQQNSSKSPCTSDINSVTLAQERNGDPSEDEETLQNWITFLEAIIHAAKACYPLTNKASELQVLEEIINFLKPSEDITTS